MTEKCDEEERGGGAEYTGEAVGGVKADRDRGDVGGGLLGREERERHIAEEYRLQQAEDMVCFAHVLLMLYS